MPIEFRCTQCQKLLRTPDETAGKKAKCPECGTLVDIPGSSAAPPESSLGGSDAGTPSPFDGGAAAGPFSSPGPQAETFNPYQTPAEVGTAGPATIAGEIRPSQIDLGDVFSRSWDVWKSQLGMCIAAALIAGVINFAVQQVTNIFGEVVDQMDPAVLIVIGLVVYVVSFLVQTWIDAGMTLFLLNVGRGNEAQIGHVFQGAPYILRFIGLGFLIGLIVLLIFGVICGIPVAVVALADQGEDLIFGTIGISALVAMIPVYYFFIRWSQCKFLIVDRDLGVMDSLRLSSELMSGNMLTMLGLYIVGGLMILAGLCALCIGALFTGSLLQVMLAVAYLLMIGQTPYPLGTKPIASAGAPEQSWPSA